jgi:hypothetical protein
VVAGDADGDAKVSVLARGAGAHFDGRLPLHHQLHGLALLLLLPLAPVLLLLLLLLLVVLGVRGGFGALLELDCDAAVAHERSGELDGEGQLVEVAGLAAAAAAFLLLAACRSLGDRVRC